MKKTVLSTALVAALSTGFADTTPPAATTGKAPDASAAPAQPAAPATATPAAQPSSIPAPQAPAEINCKYHIPAETTNIEQSVITTWAGKAAVESFDFNPATIDEELGQLKACYTEPGWQSFYDALQKSGNIDAIKLQHLTVSSQVDGDIKVNPVKENQWKVTVPLQVVYQNDKEKLTQLLTIDFLIGRKISGDLGIMQVIATPRNTTLPATPEQTTATSTGQQPATGQPSSAETPPAKQ